VALLGIYFEIDGLPDLAPLACGSLRSLARGPGRSRPGPAGPDLRGRAL